MPGIQATISPTGGAILLDITLSEGLDPNTSNITLTRYAGSLSSTPVILINNGLYTPVYLDVGDYSPNYLDFSTSYYYVVQDSKGSAVVGPTIPATQLVIYDTYLDKTIFRLFAAGINSVSIPQGWRKIHVEQAMPLTWATEPVFPFIVMNLDLEQQEYTQIGENVNFSLTNITTIPLIVYRRYSLSILSQDSAERDFYKDSCKVVLYSMMAVLRKIGFDVTYDFQAANSQATDDNKIPGFYECQIMLDITGPTNIVYETNYGIIESVVATVSAVTSGSVVVFQA